MMYVISISYPSRLRKPGSRACPGLDPGATAKALEPWIPAVAGMTNNLLVLRNSFSFGL